MNPLFKRFVSAGKLMRRGNLAAATAEIQRAMRTATKAAAAARHPPPQPAPRAPPVRGPFATPATPATPAPKADGDGQGRVLEGTYQGALGARAWLLCEPSERHEKAPPLVLMLHGCTQNPADFARGTRMSALANARGWPVLYVAQPTRSNANKCWNWFVPADQHRGAGEPALLAALVAELAAAHAFDTRRVFVAGLSAGGAMAATLAREYPDAFVAAGVHSGVRPGAAQDVASAFSVMRSGAPVKGSDAAYAPLIVFHGDADPTVAVVNGRQLVEAALGSDTWTTARESGSTGRAWERTDYRRVGSPVAPPPIELWIVHGAGHAWSGGDAAGSYTDPRGPDASAEMLRFFEQHAAARMLTDAAPG